MLNIFLSGYNQLRCRQCQPLSKGRYY